MSQLQFLRGEEYGSQCLSTGEVSGIDPLDGKKAYLMRNALPTRGSRSVANIPMITKSLVNICHVALDLDGTLYKGGSVFEQTGPFLATLAELGIGCSFLTNNPSRSTEEYLGHLQRFGIHARAEQLFTSTQATIDYLRHNWPTVHRLFVLGTPGMCKEFESAGFLLLPDDPHEVPDGVVVGFDLTLTYPRLCRAAWWIKKGKPWFATNPDRVCPTDLPTVLVDCGSITAALETATGQSPVKVLGKPDPAVLESILRRNDLRPEQLAMVGDRLYTDMEMAKRAGVFSVLVLSGETTATDVEKLPVPPDLVVPTVADFGARLRESRRSKTAADQEQKPKEPAAAKPHVLMRARSKR